MKYALFSDPGMPIGFYSIDIHGPFNIDGKRNPAYPSGVVEITDDVWQDFLNNQGRRRWNGKTIEVYTPPVTPPPIPKTITDRQFFAQLALDGVITFDEAEATSDGTMPKLLTDILDQIPDAKQRFLARMLAKNATSYDRDQDLVVYVAGFLKWDAARLDKLWSDASKL
ncbi:hypothetical protein [Methylobacterium sp. WL120]|uniref:hypothetical protein n=1 Tax=Methylobacterium sp. WL120 TaxID=2603887 RepID=UPI0011C8730F|nr:hypothetical protein [Methylobacterium sp. WL120]TXM68207.1 hypothetical protein FV229_08560 [Methylobacterium sp. WL120]